MTFNRDNATGRNETLGIPTRSHTPAWIAGVGVLAVIVLGAYGYESGMWGTHAGIDTAPTRDVTQVPAPVNPAPSPDPAKPQ
jgi:hypothetical protein